MSASGPTTTCTTVPAMITPCAPSARSAFSSTRDGSRTSVRRRVMHPSTSTMLPAPPSPLTIASALAIGGSPLLALAW
jgi:hypothetical protein